MKRFLPVCPIYSIISIIPIIAAVVFLLSLQSAAHAQVGVYAMFTADRYTGVGIGPNPSATQSTSITPYGATAGFYDDALHAGPVHLGYDARFKIDNSGNSTPYGNKLLGGLAGGRLDVNAIVLPFRPYVQAEAGVIGTNNGTNYTRNNGFAYQVQAGGDFTLVPHVGIRVEYGVGQVKNDGQNNTLQSFSAGLVLRL